MKCRHRRAGKDCLKKNKNSFAGGCMDNHEI